MCKRVRELDIDSTLESERVGDRVSVCVSERERERERERVGDRESL